jgi:hypothetical protein
MIIGGKMRKILYWGNKRIGNLFKKESTEIYIAKNFQEFESLISQFLFPVFYVESTRTCLIKMKEIVRKHPEKKFYVLSRDDAIYPNFNSFSLVFDEQNVIHRVFGIKELIEELEKVYDNA